jgi:ATP-binding cassette, subfamily B, multidrug efflux pump
LNNRPSQNPPQKQAIGRAVRYLLRYRKQAALPYVFLVIATLSQLAVPRLVRNIIDAVTEGVTAKTLLERLPSIPQTFMAQALPQVLDFLNLPQDWSSDQLFLHLQGMRDGAPTAILVAAGSIVLFALLRGIFAFLQTYWAEKNSQSVAFDLRNDLYAKLQNLSFSYHDRNSTGQLMIRATDDVEKVRIFIGQGLLQLVGALLLLTGTLTILFTTNSRLALVALWILPVALVLFMIFGAVSRPLFARVQMRLSLLNTTLQENMAGIKVVQAFTREKSEQAKFERQAGDLMNQQIFIVRLVHLFVPIDLPHRKLGPG